MKNEKELDQIDGPRAKAAKDNIVNEAIQQEEELLQKEDELYEDLNQKEEKLVDLEEEKEAKIEEAKEHLEKSRSGETPPPESQFAKLAPSENKYTILDKRDEL